MGHISLKIDDILLDEDNPRIVSVESQRDALQKIIRDQGEKLIVLSRDLLRHGLSPIESILVTRSKKPKGRFIALEGNRRVAVLKILRNPHVLNSLDISAALRKKFEKQAESFKRHFFEPLQCYEVETREEGTHWIELRHNGEDGGRGTVRWSPLVAARFRGENYATQALEFVKEKAELTQTDLEKLESPRFPLTTLERVLSAVSIREKIGIDVRTGNLYTTVKDEEVLKPLRKIVLDLGYKRINVSELKSVKQMEKYLDSFDTGDKADLDKSTKPTKTKKKTKKKTRRKKTAQTKPRLTVIPKSTDYEISDARTQKIYEELKALDVNVFQNSCGVLMRLFLEFSLTDYFRRNKTKMKLKYDSGKKAGQMKDLNDMLSEVIDDLVAKDLSLATDFKFLKNSVNNRKSPLFVGLLHQFVHNRYFMPNSEELRTTWDNSKPLFDAIWQ